MVEREVAFRMFAKELNDSVLTIHSTIDEAINSDGHTPNYLLTPLGSMVNRVFIVGVITEVDNVGNDIDTWKARIVDPSGAFTIYAGQYQPQAAIFLSSVETPAFVSVVGKVRVYKPDPGTSIISLRPEEIHLADEKMRNDWVIDTAELTLDRVETFSEMLSSCESVPERCECIKNKANSSEISEGICLAIDNYDTGFDYLDEMRSIIKKCIVSIDLAPSSNGEKDMDVVVMELLEELDEGKGVDYLDLLSVANSRNINEKAVDSSVRSLLAKGSCYEPKIGIIRPIS
ncbi:RPA family protein [Methanococcoides methylutens]|uniref:Glycerol dehydrogenase n=1 Tax=Methanococcoides methylutens MM1 TaxID=1434104 RepID=A0A0E3STG0_METMT|nr:DNA-binding protein [Methanococcoides methylutens]AKB85917.1 Glycerol dehydrogenase [Methanococcoides methylutens MM1]